MTATADPPTAPVAVVPDPPAPAPKPKHRRRDGDTVPAWVAYSGVGVVGITALIVLAYYQHQFGARAQMPWLLSWTFSIGLDWGSAVAGVFWFFGRGDVKRWGRIAAIALLIGSTTITCVAWGMMSGWYWAPVGLIHPLVAFLMVKLLTVWQADRAERRAAADEQPDIIADLHQQLTDLRAAAEQDREQTTTRLTGALAELEHLTGQLADVRGQLAEREEELAAIERRKRADRRERERADDERREAQNRGPGRRRRRRRRPGVHDRQPGRRPPPAARAPARDRRPGQDDQRPRLQDHPRDRQGRPRRLTRPATTRAPAPIPERGPFFVVLRPRPLAGGGT
jgi:hypothetical protein